MRVLNILLGGNVGGIEQLCKNIGLYAGYENTFCFLHASGEICEEMRSLSLHVESLSDGQKKFDFEIWKRLYRLVQEHDMIVLQHRTVMLQFYYLLLTKVLPKKKYIMMVHAIMTKGASYQTEPEFLLKKWLFRCCAAVSDRVLFVSEAGRQFYLKNCRIDAQKTAVVYNGIVNPEHTDSTGLSGRKHDWYQLTYIGRLYWVKGVPLLLDAVSLLQKSGWNIRLWVIGDGPQREELLAQVEKLRLSGTVSFTGTRRDIGRYLSESDVFIYPSVWEEIFGISIVEAMSYGVPCVANRVGGIPEILRDGWNGYFTRETSGAGVAEAIEKILCAYKTGESRRLRENCLQTAREFDIHNTIRALTEEFNRLSENRI